MNYNEIKQTLRRLLNQKIFLGINVLGLTLGIVFSILAFLFSQYEFNFDKHFTNVEEAYLMSCNNGRNKRMHFSQPPVYMNEILNEVPEISSGTKFRASEENVKIGEHRFISSDFAYVDSNFFDFIGWEFVVGQSNEVLTAPFSITISESVAEKYFKNEDPIGKIINIENEYDLVITGVFKNIPKQSHFGADFIVSTSTLENIFSNYYSNWGSHNSLIYLKLEPHHDLNNIQNKIAKVWNDKTTDRACTGSHIKSQLVPFKDIYLKSGEVIEQSSAYDYVLSFILIASFILIISCFNFVNLTGAIQSKRTSEYGIKKVLGANFKVFTRQLLQELSVYLIVSVLISLLLIKISLPAINSLIDKELTFSLIENPQLLIFIVLLIICLLFICAFIPLVQILKANSFGRAKGVEISTILNKSSKRQRKLQNALVIGQFAIGIILIVASFTINKQLKLIRQHDIGFNKEQVLVIENYEGDQIGRYNQLKDYLLQFPEIESITCGSNVPMSGINNWGGASLTSNKEINMQGCGYISVDHNYLNAIEAKIIKGRDFKEGNADIDRIIITEELANILNLEEPVGVKLSELWDNKPREIVGVIKNIEFNTIHTKSLPIVFFCKREGIRYHNKVMIKIGSGMLPKMMQKIQDYWEVISPNYPMQFSFMDDVFSENYTQEILTAKIVNVMTIVAILLCSLGLFGLALFNINYRIKEIGIRKVNGAKVFDILKMLNASYVLWVIIAFVVASPVAYVLMNKWLQSFAYKTSIDWWIYLLAGTSALVIALLTVSWQTIKAASKNPVESLRYE